MLVQVPVHVQPVQVDDFPEKCERSVKGSLRVRPGTLQLTKAEYDHICKAHKALGAKLVVVKYNSKEDFDVDKSILGKQAKVQREKAAAAMPMRASDQMTARAKKQVEKAKKVEKGETKKAADNKPVMVSDLPPSVEPKPDKPPKGKTKP